MNRHAARAARALACAVVVVAASAAAARAVAPGPIIERDGLVYVVRSARVEYRFDPVFRTESLVRVGTSAGERPGEADALRAALLRHLDVREIQEIPQEGEAELRSLRALGYL